VGFGYDLGLIVRVFTQTMLLRSSFALLLTVLAVPTSGQVIESGCQDKVVVEQVLNYVNKLRAQGHACGQSSFEPALPLRWEQRLEQTAQGHAAELAQGDQINHLAANGLTLRDRLRLNGYLAMRVGENLAAGQESLDEVLQTWSSSSKHCENLMQPAFKDVALVCASGPGKYGRYWVLNLGRSVQD
jgi:uncharacterized protein YkwD